jgi:transcriptional regulator with XRE-family HTH domain
MVTTVPAGNPDTGKWLAQRRTELGLSQAKVARETERLGARVSQSYLSQIESGDRAVETLGNDRVSALRTVLRIEPAEWTERTGREPTLDNLLVIDPEIHAAIERQTQENNEMLRRLLSLVGGIEKEIVSTLPRLEPTETEDPKSLGYQSGEKVRSIETRIIQPHASDPPASMEWRFPGERHGIVAHQPKLDTLFMPLFHAVYLTFNDAPVQRLGQVVLVEARGYRFLAYALDLKPRRVRVAKQLTELGQDTTLTVDHYFGYLRGIAMIDPTDFDAPSWVLTEGNNGASN